MLRAFDEISDAFFQPKFKSSWLWIFSVQTTYFINRSEVLKQRYLRETLKVRLTQQFKRQWPTQRKAKIPSCSHGRVVEPSDYKSDRVFLRKFEYCCATLFAHQSQHILPTDSPKQWKVVIPWEREKSNRTVPETMTDTDKNRDSEMQSWRSAEGVWFEITWVLPSQIRNQFTLIFFSVHTTQNIKLSETPNYWLLRNTSRH